MRRNSLRVFADPGKYQELVPFRLRTEGSPPKLVWLAWIKKGKGPKTYAVRYDTSGRGSYRLPDPMPTVGYGAGGGGAHADTEYADIPRMVEACKVYAEIALRM